MDHVILNSSNSFASQIGNTAYIFEIRYDFSLSNGIVSIPNGSVLLFNGGSLSNGTIESDDCRIESPLVKIFDNCTFSGNFLIGTVFQIEWFVANYETSLVANSTKDASTEINQAMNSGIKKIHFNNDRYYHIKQPIVVNPLPPDNESKENREYGCHLEITGRGKHMDPSGNWYWREPCIYSNCITTLFQYHFFDQEVQNGTSKLRLNIQGLNFCCFNLTPVRDEVDLTPVVLVRNMGSGTLFGLYVDVNIVVHKDSSDYKYTGVQIEAVNAPITFIELSGSVSNAYMAYKVKGNETTASPWVTDVKIWADTTCVKGGIFSGKTAVVPVRNFGSHQAIAIFNAQANGEAFFECDQFKNYGYIWDVGTHPDNNSTIWNCQFAVKPQTANAGFRLDESQSLYHGASLRKPSDAIYPNLLADSTVKYRDNDITTQTEILAYTAYNEEESSSNRLYAYPNSQSPEENLNFLHYKFPKRLSRWDIQYLYVSRRSDAGGSVSANSSLTYTYRETITLQKTNKLCCHQDMLPLYFCPSMPQGSFTLKIEYFEDGTTLSHEIDIDQTNYNAYQYGRYIKVDNLFLGKVTMNAKVVISYFQVLRNTTQIPRPMFFIPNYHASHIVRAGGDSDMARMVSEDAGEMFFHETYGQLWWNGTKWVERDGASAGVRRSGTFAQRPSGSDVYVGFRYFCTSGAKINQAYVPNVELFYTSSGWVDALGRTATAN